MLPLFLRFRGERCLGRLVETRAGFARIVGGIPDLLDRMDAEAERDERGHDAPKGGEEFLFLGFGEFAVVEMMQVCLRIE